MKKLVSLLLALFVLCGAVALAETLTEEGSTQVTLTLTVEGGFEVVFPASLDFGTEPQYYQEIEGEQHYNYVGEDTISVTRNQIEQEQLVITASSANKWVLKNEDTGAELGYDLYFEVEAEGVWVEEGKTLIANQRNTADCTVKFSTDSMGINNFPAGTLTDTLTFEVDLQGSVTGE